MVDTRRFIVNDKTREFVIHQIMNFVDEINYFYDEDETDKYEESIKKLDNKALDDEYSAMIGEFVLNDTECDKTYEKQWLGELSPYNDIDNPIMVTLSNRKESIIT